MPPYEAASAELVRLRAMVAEQQDTISGLYEQMRQHDYTHRGYATESESVKALVDHLEDSGSFIVHTEVKGRYLFLRPEQDVGTPRIDVVIEPTPQLVQQGWSHGAVGIECKKSGVAIGAPLNQALDYKRALFKVRDEQFVHLNYALVWPWLPFGGPILSICAQQRLGGASMNNYDQVVLASAKQIAIIGRNGKVSIAPNKVGKRAGSR